MFKGCNLFWGSLLLVGQLNCASATEVPWLKTAVAGALDRLDSSLARVDADVESRDLACAALSDLILNQNAAGHADRYLGLWFSLQNTDSNSASFGNVPWNFQGTAVEDPNAIEFGAQCVAAIYSGYRNMLSPQLQNAGEHLRSALVALKRHVVRVSYTNIFLMNSLNKVLLGQIVGDKEVTSTGLRQINEWMTFTQANGITEYDSPPYYKVDLLTLGSGFLYAKDAQLRGNLKKILDYFWQDIAANYFDGTQTLGGPHSRDYEFLSNRGGIDIFTYLYGLRSGRPPKLLDLSVALLLDSESRNGYRPDPSVSSIARKYPRVVTQKWGGIAGKDRTTYLTENYTLGSCSADYGPQDKSLSVELASKSKLTNITLVVDDSDEPYGKNLRTENTGHSKPTHLPSHPVSVQKENRLLLLGVAQPAKTNAGDSLATNILLPLSADAVLVDQEPVSLVSGTEILLAENSVVTVREGAAQVSVRVLASDICEGHTGRRVLKVDPTGFQNQTARIALYHAARPTDGATPVTNCAARFGLIVVANHFDSEASAAAAIQSLMEVTPVQDFDNHQWSVSVILDHDMLEASTDLSRFTLNYRRINGVPLAWDTLSVNGKKITLVPDATK